MSTWQGFVKESKSWMSYNKLTVRGKVRFWLRFPLAALRFYALLPMRDATKTWVTRYQLWRER